MTEHIDIRGLIRRGPADRDEAQAIVAAVMETVPEPGGDTAQRLSSALMEMLVCRQLRSDCFEARAAALAIIDGIEASPQKA
jgi:hypothetical protein